MKRYLLILALAFGGSVHARDPVDLGVKYIDEYWAARGKSREDYGHVYRKRNDIQAVKIEPKQEEKKPAPLTAESLFAQKMAEHHGTK
jgi:hypothetical protein